MMTIHRALSELKMLDKRIGSKINELDIFGIYQKGQKVFGIYPPDEFTLEAKGNYQSVVDLIFRQRNIKSAIVLSNSVTKVTVAGKEMTVAEAITFKELVKHEEEFLRKLRYLFGIAKDKLAQVNKQVDDQLQKILEATLGKDNVKVGADDYKAVAEPFLEKNRFHFLDPINAQEEIKKKEDFIEKFKSEVDAVLSESNASTFISID